MIRAWLELSTFGIFATLGTIYYGVALILVGLTSSRLLSMRLRSIHGIVARFFSSVSVDMNRCVATGMLEIDCSSSGTISG